MTFKTGDIVRITGCRHYPPHTEKVVRLVYRYNDRYPEEFYGASPGSWHVEEVSTGRAWSWEAEANMTFIEMTAEEFKRVTIY